MKKLHLIISSIFISICSIGQNSGFIISRDTIDINVEGKMEQSLIIGDKYYCFFTRPAQNNSVSEKKMYIISSDGNVAHYIDSLPKEFHNYYSDFHFRGGRILLKDYYNKNTYVFDNSKLQWEATDTADDLIYEDERFYVTSLDFGEWGGATWFKDKSTGKEYQLGITTPKINRLNDSYFLTLGNRILEVKNPLELHECSPEEYYEYTVENETFYDELYYREGAETIYASKENNSFGIVLPDECPTYIRSSFAANERLYHLFVDSCKLYIAELKEGELGKVELRKIKIIDSGSSFSSYNNKI